jgi:hypothetical protein
VLFTFVGVGIAVLVMFIAKQLSSRAQAREPATPQAAHGT